MPYTPVTREMKVKGHFDQACTNQHLPYIFLLTKLTRSLVARVVAAFVEFARDEGTFVLPCDTGITVVPSSTL